MNVRRFTRTLSALRKGYAKELLGFREGSFTRPISVKIRQWGTAMRPRGLIMVGLYENLPLWAFVAHE
jgi:hypothetical protein